MDEHAPSLTAEEMSGLDSTYRSFPAFSQWPGAVPNGEALGRTRESFRATTAGADEQALKRAQEVAMRAAAFDTGAIEGLYRTDRGLTLTVAWQAAAWEQAVDERGGADALELFKAQLEAFELVLDMTTERFPEVSHAWIRRLHEVLTGPQENYVVHTPVGPQLQPLPHGRYKEYPNHVRLTEDEFHVYAPVEQTHSEVSRLIQELESDAFKAADPVLQASYAHYAFVVVHPFADGNGRVARALASAFTYRAAGIPLMIAADNRERYLGALAMADAGDPVPYVALISRAVREALEMVTESLKTAAVSEPGSLLSKLDELRFGQGDLKHEELDALANEVADRFPEILEDRFGALPIPENFAFEVRPNTTSHQTNVPDGFRSITSPGGRNVDLRLKSSPPASAEKEVRFRFFVSTGSDLSETVLVAPVNWEGERVVLSLEDLRPAISLAAQHRLTALADRIISFALQELIAEAEHRVRQAGYLGP